MSPFFVTVLSLTAHISKFLHLHTVHRPNVVVLFFALASK